MQSEYCIIAYLMGDNNVTLFYAAGPKDARKTTCCFWTLEPLTHFNEICCRCYSFIETKMSGSEIVPLITFPWESFQSFWGQFISREASKQDPWSSQSENSCFNGSNNKKSNPFWGSVQKVWFLFHTGMKTFPDLRNFCGNALLISGCLSQKLHSLLEKQLACRYFAGPAILWPTLSCLDFGGDITQTSATLCSPTLPAQKPLAMRRNCLIFCLAFLHLLKCAKGFTKTKVKVLWP